MNTQAIEWVTVKIPRDLADQCDNLIGKEGFKSRADIVAEAIKDFLKVQKVEA